MRAGKLDQRVAFYRPTTASVDTSGADVAGTPTTLGTRWASVRYLSGRELEQARQLWGESDFEIEIRRWPSVTLVPKDYCTWRGRTLDIKGILGQDTRADCIRVMAKERQE